MKTRGLVGKTTHPLFSPVFKLKIVLPSILFILQFFPSTQGSIYFAFLKFIFDWVRSVRNSSLSAFLSCWSVGLFPFFFCLSFVAHGNVLQPFRSVRHLGFGVKHCFSGRCLTDLKKTGLMSMFGVRKIRHLSPVPCINERTIRMN